MATTTEKNQSATTAGTTVIADGVVEKVVGIAARTVPGVHDLGGGAARAIGSIRSAIGQQDRGQGVKVEVGEKQVAADVTVVAEYPEELQAVASAVRGAVARAIVELLGMEPAEINVTVADVYIPGDDSEDGEKESRVV